MRSPSPNPTRLVQNIVRIRGSDPSGFQSTVLVSGVVCVRSPTAAAYYLPDGWISKFTRHLHCGYFDTRSAELYNTA